MMLPAPVWALVILRHRLKQMRNLKAIQCDTVI